MQDELLVELIKISNLAEHHKVHRLYEGSSSTLNCDHLLDLRR